MLSMPHCVRTEDNAKPAEHPKKSIGPLKACRCPLTDGASVTACRSFVSFHSSGPVFITMLRARGENAKVTPRSTRGLSVAHSMQGQMPGEQIPIRMTEPEAC